MWEDDNAYGYDKTFSDVKQKWNKLLLQYSTVRRMNKMIKKPTAPGTFSHVDLILTSSIFYGGLFQRLIKLCPESPVDASLE